MCLYSIINCEQCNNYMNKIGIDFLKRKVYNRKKALGLLQGVY